MKLILLSLLLLTPLIARPLIISWTPFTQDETSKIDGFIIKTRANPTDLWEEHGRAGVNASKYQAEFDNTDFDVVVHSYKNAFSESGEQVGIIISEKSEWIRIPAGPPMPKGLKLEITFKLQRSEDLVNWETHSEVTIVDTGKFKPTQFFKIN